MLSLRLLFIVHLALVICPTNAELSTKDRIKIHKAWLDKHGITKGLEHNNDVTNKITYLRKLIKLNNNSIEPMSEDNDISSPKNNPNENEENETGNVNTNEILSVRGGGGGTGDRNVEGDGGALKPGAPRTIAENITVTTTTEEGPVGKEEASDFATTTFGPATELPPAPQLTTETTVQKVIPTSDEDREDNKRDSGSSSRPADAVKPSDDQNSTLQHTTQDQLSSGERITLERKKNATFIARNVWGPWSGWSPCSRSCGGGVKTQMRKCLKKELSIGKRSHNRTLEAKGECIGLFKRYHVCNEDDCPSSKFSFREEQCKHFNNQIFQGKRYLWEAYIKEDAECELNCKPIGMKYFATLNKTVIDGTPCTKPLEYFRRNNSKRAVCVDGICKAVHNSGVISGAFMNNGAVRCGTLVCRPVTGIFTKSPLQNGYVHVATIPAGASNISITELKNSMNFLVLRTSNQKYILNGDYTVSVSGQYEGAGAVFDYRRIDGLTNGTTVHGQGFKKIESVTEWITSNGPTTEPIHLMVLAQHSNPGIKYEYLLPINSHSSEEDTKLDNAGSDYGSNELDSSPNSISAHNRHVLKSGEPNNSTTKPIRKRRFSWKVVGFHPCSKTCGGGTQSPVIRCVRESPTRTFSAKRCAHLKQPVLNENIMRCNTQPCPAYWKISEWSECNCGNYNEEVHQTREVKCVQELMSGIVIQVNSGACIENQPRSKEKCDCLKQLKTPALEIYKHKPTTLHHVMKAEKNYTLHKKNEKKAGVWLTTEWNEQCSAVCGIGLQYRSIFCERSLAPNSERCDLRFTPDTTRECTNNEKCAYGEWFVGPWSVCTGNCFNLTRTRSIVCIKNDGFAPNSDCDESEKPITLESCRIEEYKDCMPKWHFAEWTECNKPCAGGTQRRAVRCLEPNLEEKQMKESDACKYTERPTAYRTCNNHDCPVTTTTTTTEDPRVDLIQNDASCRDDFPNCSIVIKARLCSYDYYKSHCCQSCRLNPY